MTNGKEFYELTDLKNSPAANAAATAFYKLPTNVRYHNIEIRMTLPAGKKCNDVIDSFQLRLGSNLQRELTPNEWDDLLSLTGPQYGIINDVPGQDCSIPFQFTEPDRETGIAKENYALDIPNGLNAAVEIKFKANATQPTIVRAVALAEPLDDIAPQFRNLDTRGLPVLTRYKHTYINPGGTSADLDTQIQALNSGRLMQLSIYDPATTGKLTRTTLRLDNRDKWDRYKVDNDVELTRYGLTARAGVMDLVTDLLDKQNDAWDMGAARKLQLKIYTDVAMTGGVTVVTKTWESME